MKFRNKISNFLALINNSTKKRDNENDNLSVKDSIVVSSIDKLIINPELRIEKIEYKIPDISVVKDDESKLFINFCKEIKSKDKVMIPIGKNKDELIIEKLSMMPNMLIGGTVMSGKTSYINTIISSILLTKTPNQIKMIIFDSKRVDYSIYNGIPHLLAPVINDSKKLYIALKKVSCEIRRRIDLLKQANVKNINQYNDMVTDEEKRVPDILIIIDDLTNLNGIEEINNGIEYISSNGWNANVYMIISSNHPSAKVLPSISKSNFPSRLCFKVTTAQVSQNIISDSGAERLSGLGNALYVSRMIEKNIKVMVPFITDNDIKSIVYNWIEQGKVNYSKDYLKEENDDFIGNIVEEEPLYNEIVEFVVTQGKASVSLLQRRFRLGYNRAARCIDFLEQNGIIGPCNCSSSREVLIKNDSNDKC